MADHSIVLRRRPLPLGHTVLVLLGMLSILAGVLGMHTLSVSHHHVEPGPAAAAPAHLSSHGAAASHIIGNSHTGTGDTGVAHIVGGDAAPAAQLSVAGPEAQSATCAGTCGTDHAAATTCLFLVVLTGLLLAFLLRKHHESGSVALRAPPPSPSWIRAIPRPPSLLELSVSRT